MLAIYTRSRVETISSVVTYANIQPLTQYYFATSYSLNKETGEYTLTGEMVEKTYSELSDENLISVYPYSCAIETKTTTCEAVVQIQNVIDESSAKVKYISYSSIDKESTRNNEYNSTIKEIVDSWYQTNIIGKYDSQNNLLTNYIVDAAFCNDRNIIDTNNNLGYRLDISTYYVPYTRLYESSEKTPTLECSIDIRDRFSTTTDKGNGNLTYPIALITADEIVFAGGNTKEPNADYYLRTSGYYWDYDPFILSLIFD